MRSEASNAVARAIRSGELIRARSCERCGSGVHVIAHHDDYAKPLDVRWLCRKCHVHWHQGHVALNRPDDLSPLSVRTPRQNALYTHRIAAGLSRDKLAARAGVTAKTVFNIERGLVEPNEATLRVLAQALGCEVTDLTDEPEGVAA
jgi:DNA-binding XRE family transcriptional regulator/ribosomal protein S27AE